MVERPDKAGPCPIPSKGRFYKTCLAYQNMQYPANPRSCAACKVFLGCPDAVSELSDVDMTLNNKVLMNYFVVASTFYVFRNGVIPGSESSETPSGQPRNTLQATHERGFAGYSIF